MGDTSQSHSMCWTILFCYSQQHKNPSIWWFVVYGAVYVCVCAVLNCEYVVSCGQEGWLYLCFNMLALLWGFSMGINVPSITGKASLFLSQCLLLPLPRSPSLSCSHSIFISLWIALRELTIHNAVASNTHKIIDTTPTPPRPYTANKHWTNQQKSTQYGPIFISLAPLPNNVHLSNMPHYKECIFM